MLSMRNSAWSALSSVRASGGEPHEQHRPTVYLAPHRHSSHGDADSSDSLEDRGSPSSPIDEEPARIHIGPSYQALIPPLDPEGQRFEHKRDMLLWAPSPALEEKNVDEFLRVAKSVHGYNAEQALGMLFWHGHSVENALRDMANFTPCPDEWSVEEKILFEQGVRLYGKSFSRIRQLLPDKTLTQLVQYYYIWKKTHSRVSLIDKYVTGELEPEDGNHVSDADVVRNVQKEQQESAPHEDNEQNRISVQDAPPDVSDDCRKCRECSQTLEPDRLDVPCLSCRSHQQSRVAGPPPTRLQSKETLLPPTLNGGRTEIEKVETEFRVNSIQKQECPERPVGASSSVEGQSSTTGAPLTLKRGKRSAEITVELKPGQTRHGHLKAKKHPPAGIFLSREQLLEFGNGPAYHAETVMKGLDTQLVMLKRQVQLNKQSLNLRHHKHTNLTKSIDCYRPPSLLSDSVHIATVHSAQLEEASSAWRPSETKTRNSVAGFLNSS